MRIYIVRIDKELTQQGSDTGYRVHFRSELTSGIALLAATHNVGPARRGQEIFVEVEAQSFHDLRVLLAEEPHQYSLAALPEEGHYQAVGQVVYAPAREEEGFPRLGVRVADASFYWTPDASERNTLSLGDWVGFTVVGLTLWDENL